MPHPEAKPMRLCEVIDRLKQTDPDTVVANGLCAPHSHRGHYVELAFELEPNVTVGSMLCAAESAMGGTFEGYKGGDYAMHGGSEVYMAVHGCAGAPLTAAGLEAMLQAEGDRTRGAPQPVQYEAYPQLRFTAPRGLDFGSAEARKRAVKDAIVRAVQGGTLDALLEGQPVEVYLPCPD